MSTPNKEPRFKVVEGSETAHCCFEASVVDTSKPYLIGGEHYDGRYESLCECMDRAAADIVCAALNAVEGTPA